MTIGDILAIIGAVLAVTLTGIGSGIGMARVQQAVAGVTSENPKKYNKVLILQLLPSSAALFGFVASFLVLLNAVMGSGGYSTNQGLAVLLLCLPIAVVGFFVVLWQSKVCAAGVMMVAKRDDLMGRALTMAIFAELFILFALIISVLSILQITPSG